MALCKSCKHWSMTDKEDPYDIGRMYFKDKEGEIGLCRIASVYLPKEEQTQIFVATCIHEGIYGELITKPNFGCILHETKAE